jgi:hypothetical protein
MTKHPEVLHLEEHLPHSQTLDQAEKDFKWPSLARLFSKPALAGTLRRESVSLTNIKLR